jgi:hypothetical protein
MTKGEVMEVLFTKAELSNVDSSIPMDYMSYAGGHIQSDEAFWFVMDYNNSVLGELVDMREKAKDMEIDLNNIVYA